MGMKLHLPLMIVSAVVVALAGCATTPSGRSQVMLVDDKQMNALGIEAFSQLKSTGKVSTNAAQKRYVRCVSDALIAELPAQWRDLPWEVEVFQDDSANAFALPGGKVGVNTGMFSVAQNADQLAAVVGHELAHVMYRHGAERMSQQLLAQAGMTAATLAANASSPENSQLIVGALGAGAQVGVLLPFSRHHEGEADLEGQRLMARAGFKPAESVTLWERMQQQSGGNRTPTWLSTHPNPGGRIDALRSGLASAGSIHDQAIAGGRRPQCRL
jgi:predicted Zn-dependent protease